MEKSFRTPITVMFICFMATVKAVITPPPNTPQKLPDGSKYSNSAVLDNGLPTNDNSICQISFPICDSTLTEETKVKLEAMGWNGLIIALNSDKDSMAVVPTEYGGLSNSKKYAYRNGTLAPILEGTFMFNGDSCNPITTINLKVDSIIDWYTEVLNLERIEKEISSTMQFPGSNTWQVKFSFAYTTSPVSQAKSK